MMTMNLKRNRIVIGWLFLTLLFLVPSVATAAYISMSGVTQDEDSGSMTFTITLDIAQAQDLYVAYATDPTTPVEAVAGIDYTAVSGVAMIPAGDTSVTVDVPISADTIVEPDEAFFFHIGQDAANPLPGGVNFLVIADLGTITNDDVASIGIIYSGVGDVAEGSPAEFQLTEANGVTLDQAYTITLSYGGTIDPATDLSSPPASLTVDGSTSFPLTFTVDTATDALIEGTEVLTVGLVDPEVPDSAQVSVGGTANANVTSADTASIGIVYSGVGDVAEGSPAEFQLTEANGVTLDQAYTITLSYGGTIDPATDLSSPPASLTVDGSTSFPLTFTVDTATDALIEGTEVLTVGLVDPEVPDSAQVSVGGTANANVTSADTASIGIVYSGVGDVAEGSPAEFQLTEANGVTLDQAYTITLSYGGTIDPATDLSSPPASLTVDGSTSFPLTFTVDTATDALIEGTEVLTVGLVDPEVPDSAQVSVGGTANANVTSADTASIGIVYSGVGDVAEGSPAEFQLTEANGVTLDQAYTITLSYGGTIDPATDLSSPPASLTVDGSTSFPLTFTVDTATDALIEGTEVLTVGLVDPEVPDSAQVSVGGTANANVTSADTASIGIVYSGVGDVAEGSPAEFQLTEANGVTLDQAYTITLSYGGTIDPATDLSSPPASLTVDGSTSFPLTFTVDTATDALIEGTEVLTVGLVDPEVPDSAQVSVGGTANANVTSADTASIGIVYSGVGDVAEGSPAEFQLTEANGVTLDQAYTITLSYGGTIDPATDLSSPPASLTVDGSTSFPLTFTVDTATDALIEGTEVLTVGLVDPEVPDSAQVSVGGTANANVTSADTASIGITYIGATPVDEGTTDQAQFQLEVTNGVTLDTDYTVNLNFSGSGIGSGDYTNPGTITVNNSTLPLTVDVAIPDDGVWEPDETMTVTLSDPNTGDQVDFAGSANCTLNNINQVAFALTTTTATVNEESGSPAAFSVEKTNGVAIESGYTIDIAYETVDVSTTAGQDYTSTSGTASFAGALGAVDFTVPILNDDFVETDQVFQARLINPSLDLVTVDTDPVDCTIQSGDTTTAYISAFPSADVPEGDVTGAYTVNLTNPVEDGGNVTVNWTAVGGTATVPDDFDVSAGAVTFGPMATSATFIVDTFPDAYVEGPETFLAKLNTPPTADPLVIGDISVTETAVGPTTIVEDDIANVTIGPSASLTVQESIDPLAMEIDFTIALDRYVLGGGSVVVNYQTIPVSATSADFVNTSGID